MMKKKNYLIIGIIIAIVVIGVIVTNNQKNEETIKIGSIMPLTGSIAGQGKWSVDAINLAVDEINSKGGINGKKIEVIEEDSKGLAADGIMAYEKLKNINNIKYILTSTSSVALAVKNSSDKDNIILMDTTATTPSYSSPNDFSFRTGITAEGLSKKSAEILFNELNATKVAMLIINNDFGKGMEDSFKKYYSGEIVDIEHFNRDTQDVRTELLKLKNKKFDYVFLVCQYKEGIIIVNQAKELGLNLKFFSNSYSIEVNDFLNGTKGVSDGMIYVSPTFNSESFSKAYRGKYGYEPNFYGAQAYDGIIALSKVLEKCDYLNTECSKDELMKLNYQGVSGIIKFDINGDVDKEVDLKTIKNGEFVKLN
jgi:branched-chain amino acid transport system substrate-binding protein